MASQLYRKHTETHTKDSDNENESYNIVRKVQVIEHIQPHLKPNIQDAVHQQLRLPEQDVLLRDWLRLLFKVYQYQEDSIKYLLKLL